MRYILTSILVAAGCASNSPISSGRDMAAPDLNPMFPSGCMSGSMDGDETDVDCGGSCPGCGTGKGCIGAKDCRSGICINRVCAAPACDDKVKNGDESDIDCGGACPTKCAEGQKCNDGPDCQSLTCVNGVCGMSPCTNGKQDGTETDVDCGGPMCMPCADGKMCSDGTDCTGGMCVNQICKSNCPAGTGDCDGNAANGCETNTNTDAKNCGGCGNVCPMGAPSCAKGLCSKFTLFPSPSYNASFTFTDAVGNATMTLAWDGVNYWGCHSGNQDSLASYDAKGALVHIYPAGLDFRSVFTFGSKKPVYAYIYNKNEIDVMGNPGTFGLFLPLTGANIPTQSSMVFDDTGAEIIAFSTGTVTRWNSATGKFISTLTLQGFGMMNNENTYPQNRGIAKAHGYYLTYSGGVLSAWDSMGIRQKTTILNGAGTTFSSYFSFSYTHGMVFVVDDGNGTWRGYDVGL